MQLVRTVHTIDQRPHVGGGAWASDEDEVAPQHFAILEIWTEEIARALCNGFRRDDRDVYS